MIVRLAARGPVAMTLVLTPQTLPDADSFNVIADWPGRLLPKEYVVVSGHLDSWDLGTGATDDVDKVDPVNLNSQIATMGVLAYYLADLPVCLSRISVPVRHR